MGLQNQPKLAIVFLKYIYIVPNRNLLVSVRGEPPTVRINYHQLAGKSLLPALLMIMATTNKIKAPKRTGFIIYE